MPILFPSESRRFCSAPGSRDRLAADPSPRLRLGTFNGRRPTRESLIGNGGGATRFPFPLPPRTIGEQKAKVNKNTFGWGAVSEGSHCVRSVLYKFSVPDLDSFYVVFREFAEVDFL
jgi:hypothetical protein